MIVYFQEGRRQNNNSDEEKKKLNEKKELNFMKNQFHSFPSPEMLA